MDVDQFEERAAIAQHDGGLSQFDAETLAAQEQGKSRWEAIHEIAGRLVERAGHHRSMAGQPRQNDVPRVQPASKKEG